MSRTQASQIQDQAEIFPSKTCESLHSAWEQAMCGSETYERAAEVCEGAKLTVIAHAFRFTAAQEREHASILAGLIGCMEGEVRQVQSLAALPDEPADLLQQAVRMEQESAEALLSGCADIARAEGHARIAMALQRIAETERKHAARFLRYLQALRTDTLFRDTARVSWFCLPCGQLHTGMEAPNRCSACGRASGQFIRSTFEPFASWPSAVNCNPAATVL